MDQSEITRLLIEGFNPDDHVETLKNGGRYLGVQWRVVWFRKDHPDWTIETQILDHDFRAGKDSFACYLARIKSPDGRIVASGHGYCRASEFNDFSDKAETSAVGRALAFFIYGTQFAPEIEEGDRTGNASRRSSKRETLVCSSEGCGQVINKGQKEYSEKNFGAALCVDCQKKRREQPKGEVCSEPGCGKAITEATIADKHYTAAQLIEQSRDKYGVVLCADHIKARAAQTKREQRIERVRNILTQKTGSDSAGTRWLRDNHQVTRPEDLTDPMLQLVLTDLEKLPDHDPFAFEQTEHL